MALLLGRIFFKQPIRIQPTQWVLVLPTLIRQYFVLKIREFFTKLQRRED